MTAYDDFAEAGTVALTGSGLYVSAPVDNSAFTAQTGEPDQDSYGYQSAWWNFTPGSDMTVTIDTDLTGGDPTDTAHDTKLSVWTGSSVDALSLVDFNDDLSSEDPQDYASILTLALTGGTTYRIRVAAYGSGYQQQVVLRVVRTGLGIKATIGPPVLADVQLVDPDGAATNDAFATPAIVTVATAGGTYTSATVDSSTYTLETGESPAYPGTRSAWWSYTPVVSGTATIDTGLSTATDDVSGDPVDSDVYLHVLTGASIAGASTVAFDYTIPGSALSLSVTANTTYHIRLARGSTSQNNVYQLQVTGPTTDATVIPPIEVAVQVNPYEVFYATPSQPPTYIDVQVVTAPLVRLATALIAPADAATVPSLTPSFQVSVRATTSGSASTITAEVQYSPVSNFGSFTTLSQTVPLQSGTNVITLPITSALPNNSGWYWRARFTFDGYTTAWSASRFFAAVTGTTSSASDVTVTWTVTTDTPDAHLWFVYPAAGSPGDTVTGYGQGFPGGAAVSIAGVSATVQAQSQVTATGAAGGSSRTIDALTGKADAEHDIITVVVPQDVAPPGGAFTVGS